MIENPMVLEPIRSIGAVLQDYEGDEVYEWDEVWKFPNGDIVLPENLEKYIADELDGRKTDIWFSGGFFESGWVIDGYAVSNDDLKEFLQKECGAEFEVVDG